MMPAARALADVLTLVRSRPAHSGRLAHAWWVAWWLAWRVACKVAKRVVPLPSLVAAVRITGAPGADGPGVCAEREAWLGGLLAGRSPLVPANCLERALLVHGTLAPAGPGTSLVVGFRRRGGAVHGHTWVVRDGVPLLEPLADLDGFVPVFGFGASGVRVPVAAGPTH